MNPIRILAIAAITVCTAAAWFILGNALQARTAASSSQLGNEVTDVWGPKMQQAHPAAFYLSPTGAKGRVTLQPSKSKVEVTLDYQPKKRGLLWHRTYLAHFDAEYEFTNPTPVAQTLYVQFPLPSAEASYQGFSFNLGGAAPSQSMPHGGVMTEAVVVPPKSSVPLKVTYDTRGMDTWGYVFPEASRVAQFQLVMLTSFNEINFPKGTGSPTERNEKSLAFTWDYPDVLSAPAIGMDMPKVLNAGPVATRISFFAPVSLVFFFTVLLIVGMVRGANMHPMNYFFLAAGCFGFQLLFAYLVDLVPIHLSFIIAAAVSLALVCPYVGAVAGKRMFWVSLAAQTVYMVLFSYSFFFDGLTGLTITIGALLTLALLMLLTAKVNWMEKLGGANPRPQTPVVPPPVPPSVPPRLNPEAA
ncbi:MAG: inner membrane CreD family protein [Verrucomicrobium sp.]|nr:inner membrane CreD family protein [Verrucomicrobium sp.]